jgi:hypothetical protein
MAPYFSNILQVLAKLTSKNQLTLPKSVTEPLGPVQYFEVQTKAGQIILTPVRIQRGDAVRAKLAELAIDHEALAEALNWTPTDRETKSKPLGAARPVAKKLAAQRSAAKKTPAKTSPAKKVSANKVGGNQAAVTKSPAQKPRSNSTVLGTAVAKKAPGETGGRTGGRAPARR